MESRRSSARLPVLQLRKALTFVHGIGAVAGQRSWESHIVDRVRRHDQGRSLRHGVRIMCLTAEGLDGCNWLLDSTKIQELGEGSKGRLERAGEDEATARRTPAHRPAVLISPS